MWSGITRQLGTVSVLISVVFFTAETQKKEKREQALGGDFDRSPRARLPAKTKPTWHGLSGLAQSSQWR
jgi:hypothetical protein